MSWGWSRLDGSFPSAGGPKKANDKYWHSLVQFLAKLEELPRIRGRVGADLGNNVCGLQKLDKMPNHAQKRWNELVKTRTDWRDVEGLYRFRLGSKQRAYALPPNGDGVSYILWIDPSHEVWPSSR